MDSISYLIVPLLQGFEWFDEGLQRAVKENCNVLHFKNAEFEGEE